MIEVRSWGAAALVALLALFAAAMHSFAAAPPAGIVLAVSGATVPPLSAMTEIPADQPIRLGGGSRLIFLDYARCKLVTVAGGTLTLNPAGYKATGRVESAADAPCPHIYALKASGGAGRTAGGIIMRGGAEAPRWPVGAVFLLTGARAGRVRAAAIYAADRPGSPVLTLALKGGRAAMPPDALPLSPNRRYRLRLSFGDGSKPVDIPFIGVVPNGPASLVVLRVD